MSPQELETSILRVLNEPMPEDRLQELSSKLIGNDRISLSDSVKQRLQELNLLQPEMLAPPSISEGLLKKENLNRTDIEKVPEALHELINNGDLQEADQLSKKLFSLLAGGQKDQKIATIEVFPAAIQALSKNERWKNVEFSLSFLISTCYRKETSPEVLHAYIPLFLGMFRRHYDAKNWQGCQDIFSTLRSQTERQESVHQEFSDAWVKGAGSFIQHIRDGATGIEAVLEGFRTAGTKGLSYLIEILADEEDQTVRSRLIGSIVSFKQEILLTELEKRMFDSRWFVVRNMVTIISKSNLKELPEFLQQAAKHPDPRVPKELIKILYKGTAKSQLGLILLLMEHPDKSIRIQAVHLVTMQANSGAIPGLLKILESGNAAESDLRTASLQALLKLRSMDGIIPAATLLDRKPSSKGELAERNAAVRLLGELAREQTRTVLERTAKMDPFPETRALAESYLT
jgi:hypothetical protein